MIRWHLQEGRSAIPKSVNPARITENFDVSDFGLSTAERAALDALAWTRWTLACGAARSRRS
jgi:2,5-diketo-D-gluconate reductase A